MAAGSEKNHRQLGGQCAEFLSASARVSNQDVADRELSDNRQLPSSCLPRSVLARRTIKRNCDVLVDFCHPASTPRDRMKAPSNWKGVTVGSHADWCRNYDQDGSGCTKFIGRYARHQACTGRCSRMAFDACARRPYDPRRGDLGGVYLKDRLL